MMVIIRSVLGCRYNASEYKNIGSIMIGMKRVGFVGIALLVAGLTAAGCREQGSGEKAGERVDEIVDNVKEGEPPLKKKGTLEKTGEAIDEAVTGDK